MFHKRLEDIIFFGLFFVFLAIIFLLFNEGCLFKRYLPDDHDLLYICLFLNEYFLTFKKEKVKKIIILSFYLRNTYLDF